MVLGSAEILGQYALTNAFRHAPVYVTGPIECTGLLWEILFGWWFFRDFPSFMVFGGAALIVAICIVIVTLEKDRAPTHALRFRR